MLAKRSQEIESLLSDPFFFFFIEAPTESASRFSGHVQVARLFINQYEGTHMQTIRD